MRQAGRNLPEYRTIRERHSLLEICRTPELAVEVTLQPVRRFGVDAAILFSDIILPLTAMGVDVDIVEDVGPVIADPIRDDTDIDRLGPLEPESSLGYVIETVRALREFLEVPLIGFGGAPFTLASYLIEGGPSKDHARTKALMYGRPQTWAKLMDRLAEAVASYLRAQITAGADAVQLFDSWVGHVPPAGYEQHVRPATERIVAGLEDLGVPRILFGVGTGELLPQMASSGVEVVGVDWRVPLDEARSRVGTRVALQGNLDPSVCLAPWHVVEEEACDVLQRGGGRGHIFNLGHGVLPGTDPRILERLVDYVHEWELDG